MFAQNTASAPEHPPTPMPQSGRELGPAEGWLDIVDPRRVVGWAWIPSSPTTRVSVDVHVDGDLVTRRLATDLRTDLRSAGKGDGCYGFAVPLDPERGVRPDSQITVTVSGTSQIIAGSQGPLED
jgi:hypothetical protein